MEKTKEIVIKIEGEKWENALDQAYKKVINKVKVDGFRKGHVPKNVFLKKYGIESLFEDASNICTAVALNQMLDENKDIELIARPLVSVKSIDKDYVEYTFTITLRPEVKLGNYKNVDVEKEEVTVTDEEVNEAIDRLCDKYKEIVVKDGEVENGDIAIIDFEGFKDGVAFEGGKGENYSLEIGSNTFIPGFEEQLIGMKTGEEKDINVTFPEDYHVDDLKGQPVIFKVKVNEVKYTKLPEFDKEFFEDLNIEGVDSKETLEKYEKDSILKSKEKDALVRYEDKLLEKIVSETEVEIPENVVNEQIERMIEDFKYYLESQGMPADHFMKLANMTEEKLKEQYHDEAVRRVKNSFIFDAIIKKENIEVTEEEIDARISEVADMYNISKEEVLKEYDKDSIKYDLQIRKVFDIFKGNK